MILFGFRVLEFVLLSALPSLLSTVVLMLISGVLFNEIVAVGSFIVMLAGMLYLGYKFMSLTGNIKKYFMITGGAYAAFILLSILAYKAGDGVFSALFRGFTIFSPLGISNGVSLIAGHAIILAFLPAVAAVEKKPYYGYGFFDKYYNKYIVAGTYNANQEEGFVAEIPSDEEREERERRRIEYESKFTNIRPAKSITGVQEKKDTSERTRSQTDINRVQQYCADEIAARKHKAVDREAELKKARALQRQLEEEEEMKYGGGVMRRTRGDKAVDKEEELKKARALQQQLEDEEEEKYRKFMTGK